MTDYGRGSGSAPWHPDDPLYGEQGWEAPQAGEDRGAQHQYGQQQDPYGAGHDPYQQYPQQPGHPGYQEQGYAAPQYPPYQDGPYPQQGYQDQQQYGQPYPGQQDLAYGDGGQGYPQGGWQQQQPQAYGQVPGGYPGQGHDPYAQPQYDPAQGGWDTGAHQQPAAYQQQPGPHQPDQQQPEQQPGPQGPAPDGFDWDDPPEETHPFFTGEDAPGRAAGRSGGRGGRAGRDGYDGRDDEDAYDDGHDDPDTYDDRQGGGKKRKGRSGVACLVVAVVLVGGVGGLGYFGYTFYQHRFGPPPDFTGTGTGTVQITVPDGANGSDIASLLLKSGVVKSAGAFVVAQNHNPKGNTIQAGVYTLKRHMSGKDAVALMLSPGSRNALIIPEGTRDATVYAMIDKKLGLKAGTTRSVAFDETKNLGLPSWADDGRDIKDPLEGFLFPASYPVARDSKPEDVLKKMVARANAEYAKYGLQTKAKSVGLDDPWQLLTVASLVQAEGKTHDDFRKMAEVVYNRLEPDNEQTHQLLQFDSTYNYLKGQSHINISEAEVNGNHDPYNTYTQKGLPPGPIGNPGEDALAAAISPTHDGWLYFVATDGDDKTEFAKTYAEFQALKQKFNDKQKGLGG
ncbi:endolytic transglycosylase MltG [Streptomyces tremellae]|uniref:Endolytic murein transglycosylase n=1 Tax=Streptomyces tremellae TaxID=1124239 RepID=A0ABP7F898_9ACTN